MGEVLTLMSTARRLFPLVKVCRQSPSLQRPVYTPMLPYVAFGTKRLIIVLFSVARNSISFSPRFGDWKRIARLNARLLLVVVGAPFLSATMTKLEYLLISVLLIWLQMLSLAHSFRGLTLIFSDRFDLISVRRTPIV
jgi:hypothetical protein